jgi:hypothetical protein
MSNISNALRNPLRAVRFAFSNPRMAVSRVAQDISTNLYWGFYRWNYRGQGENIVDLDWDYLFILDSCRYDLLKEEYEDFFDGDLDRIESKGSETGLFLERNFAKKEYEDIVYVSANPRIDELGDIFYEKVKIWEHDWNEETGLVSVEDTKKHSERTIKLYPEKRIIFHFLQPHLSIKSSEDLDYTSGLGESYADKSPLRKFFEGKISKSFPGVSPWVLLQEDKVSDDQLKELQRRKLREALGAVQELAKICDGNVVITSDHGNCYGEKIKDHLPWKIYEHPPNVRHKNLVNVPWLKAQNGD